MTADPGRGCEGCRDGGFGARLEMAFQPIVDVASIGALAYEALVRGPNGESAPSVLATVTPAGRYGFDQACRVRAIELAAEIGLAGTGALLSINFMPNAVYRPEACLRTTFEAARRTGFPLGSILFEFTETEEIVDVGHLKDILAAYRRMGFRTAIDDFGAGHSGLNLLADLQPDYLKLDMHLVRGVDRDGTRRAILGGMAAICRELGILPIAEGVETEGEFAALRDLGFELFQGYLFARPGFRSLPHAAIPATATASAPA